MVWLLVQNAEESMGEEDEEEELFCSFSQKMMGSLAMHTPTPGKLLPGSMIDSQILAGSVMELAAA